MSAEDEKEPSEGRSTAPQSPYTMRAVGIGFVILVVGLAIAFAIPALLSAA